MSEKDLLKLQNIILLSDDKFIDEFKSEFIEFIIKYTIICITIFIIGMVLFWNILGNM